MRSIELVFALSFLTVAAHGLSPDRRSVRESDFARAGQCGKCHEDIYRQWSRSMHSRSFSDPVYRAVVERMIAQTGRRNQIFCLSCHAPVATVAGTVLSRPSPLTWDGFSPLASEGVTCDFCHTIAANPKLGGRILVGGYQIDPQAQAVKFGPRRDADGPPHPTRSSPLLQGSEFCATCQSYKHPVLAVEIQNTYQEWLDSQYPGQGVGCQECHMPQVAGRGAKDDPGSTRLASHEVEGGQGSMIEKALRFDLTGEVERAGRARVLNITGIVTNHGAGHRVPTGIPGIRELWIELQVYEGAQELAAARFSLGQKLRDEKGGEALPWEAYELVEDLRVAPGQTVEKSLALPLIADLKGPLRISGQLLYQRIAENVSRRLDLPSEPPRRIASKTIEVGVQ